MLNQSESSD